MSKPKSKRGMCGKNALPKRGLTPTEAKMVKLMLQDMKDRWAALLSLNKWKPQTNTERSK